MEVIWYFIDLKLSDRIINEIVRRRPVEDTNEYEGTCRKRLHMRVSM